MTLDLFLKRYDHSCRNQRRETIRIRLAAVSIIIFSGTLVPLWGQGRPFPSRSVDAGASQPRTESVAMVPAAPKDYEISPDDLLEVYVFDVPEISREYRISPNGSIHLPLLAESIDAVGLTPSQLSDVISGRLRTSRLVGNPRVTVEVKESRIHSVAITGAVKRPQIYPVFGQTTLLDVLSQAEGLTDDAGSTAVITRGEFTQRRDGEEAPDPATTVTLDLRRLLETGDTGANAVLYPGDRVTVPHAGIFYVLGAVARPGGYNLRDAQEPITVLMALATASGMTSTAKSQKAVLFRKNAMMPEGREEIALNLKEIVSGHLHDQKMQADDILFVPESNGKKAAHATLAALGAMATSTTSGVIVYGRY